MNNGSAMRVLVEGRESCIRPGILSAVPKVAREVRKSLC